MKLGLPADLNWKNLVAKVVIVSSLLYAAFVTIF